MLSGGGGWEWFIPTRSGVSWVAVKELRLSYHNKGKQVNSTR